MPLNLEIKIKLKSHTQILRVIRKLNAGFKWKLTQKDIYYKTSKGLLKLRLENGRKELIKYLRDEGGGDRWSNYEFIDLKGDNAEKFFDEIFEREVTVEKVRTLYLYDGTRIHLDKVKKLGCFLELETVVDKGRKDALNRFNKLLDKLELDVGDQIRMSYKDLMLGKRL